MIKLSFSLSLKTANCSIVRGDANFLNNQQYGFNSQRGCYSNPCRNGARIFCVRIEFNDWLDLFYEIKVAVVTKKAVSINLHLTTVITARVLLLGRESTAINVRTNASFPFLLKTISYI